MMLLPTGVLSWMETRNWSENKMSSLKTNSGALSFLSRTVMTIWNQENTGLNRFASLEKSPFKPTIVLKVGWGASHELPFQEDQGAFLKWWYPTSSYWELAEFIGAIRSSLWPAFPAKGFSIGGNKGTMFG